MDIDEEELPRLRKTPTDQDAKMKSNHSMPSASVLAAARQLEAEEDIKVAEILSRRLNFNTSQEKPDINEEDSFIDLSETINEVEMKIKAEINSNEENLILDEQDENMSCPDNDLASCIQSLQMQTPKYTVLRENPGIDLEDFNLDMISECISESRLNFLKSAIRGIMDCENEDNINISTLDYLLSIISTMGMEPSLVFKLEDYLCSTLLITAIILDRKCRLMRTSVDKFDILNNIMERVSRHSEATNVMVILSRMIITHFKHFHDRLFIAEGLIRNNCDPQEMDVSPSNISNRMSKYILYSSLLDLVEYTKERLETKECYYYSDLKHVIVNGKRSKCLDLYEQYILISTLMALFPMVTFKNTGKEREEKEAFNWLLTFLQSLKHNKHHHTTADLLRVKSLNSLKNLLFQRQIVHVDP